MAALQITQLHAGYPGKPIINGLTLSPLVSGEVTVLTGPNAAGKSTLLRAIAGLLRVRGLVMYEQQELSNLSPQKRSEIVSFMPQSVSNDINLSVMEAVISALKASPLDTATSDNQQFHRRAIAILERIGIPHLALEPLNQLSGGQRQMASLARSVVREPKVLLLDEPTSALDLRHQLKVMRLAQSFAADGRIVIMVLHDLNLALRWAHRIIVMDKGMVISDGRPTDAVTPEIIAQVYGVQIRVESCTLGLPNLIVDREL